MSGMIELSYSTGLWGLLGMLVPLVIHLLSKQKQTEIAFGSIQFLEETASDKARSIQLSQYALLLLRMIIMGLLAMIISRPTTVDRTTIRNLYVPSSVMADDTYDSVLANYTEDEYTYRPYRHKYDALCDNCQHYESLNALINKANRDPDSSIILTYGMVRDVIAPLPDIAGQVQTIQLPAMQSSYTDTMAINDSLYQLNTDLQGGNIVFTIEKSNIGEASSTQRIGVCINASSASSKKVDQFFNLLKSISSSVKYDVVQDCQNYNWMIIIDTTISTGGVPTLYWDSVAEGSKVTWDGGVSYKLNGALNATSLQSSNFPLLLANLLSFQKLEVDRFDRRTADLGGLKRQEQSVEKVVNRAGISHYLWYLLIALLCGERIMSYYKLER